MDIYSRIKQTIESQLPPNSFSDEQKIEGLTRLITIEIQCIATQYARYMVEREGERDYSYDLHNFMEEGHYNTGA